MLDQHFLYFPTSEIIGSPGDYGIAYEDVTSSRRRTGGGCTGGSCRARAT